MSHPPIKSAKTRYAATLADVGREAGVSAMAVSAVLNGAKTSARIADETRERILAAAEKLRYRPNATARALVDRRMNTLGVATTLSRDEFNQYFLEVFYGVIEAASAAGQNTTVFAVDDWQQGAGRIASLCDGRIDGLILLAPLFGPEAAAALPDHTPLVSIHANHALPGVVNLESDEEAGACEMTHRLLAMGHRRILHIGGPADAVGAARRVAGLRRAHAEAGVSLDDGLLLQGGFTAEFGRAGLAEWLRAHVGEPLPQAIFAGSDAIALGVLDTLADWGLRVPADLSVVGFDGTQLARSARMATVRQPLRELGHRAVEVLVQRIDAKLANNVWRGPTNLVLPTESLPGATLAVPASEPALVPPPPN